MPSPPAALITRGAARAFMALGHAVLREVTLPNGRRADLLALGADGSFAIVEVKASARDFRADAKWPEYRDFCDRLYFAVEVAFPTALLPAAVGVVVADAHGGAVLREAPAVPLAPARRRALLALFARLAAQRLETLLDPAGPALRRPGPA